jgi:energy-coupling factor transport system ATP-binding protein
VVSEHRAERLLDAVDRVVFVEAGRVLLDAGAAEARAWLARERPAWVESPPLLEPPDAGELVASLERVSYAYGDRPAVDGADLELRRGEVVALTGPNGSGKTTVAKLASQLIAPGAGAVRLSGRAAYLSQDPGRYLTRDRADAEVALGIGGDTARARRWLAALGLSGLEARHPRDLSSGERERLALAAVAVAEPDVLILDEPTRGVDPERKAALGAWLEQYAASGKAVVVATHDHELPSHRRIGLCVSETQAAPRGAGVGA